VLQVKVKHFVALCARTSRDSCVSQYLIHFPGLQSFVLVQDQRMDHLQNLKALVRDQTGDIYCKANESGHPQGPIKKLPADAASKAAAKALKKERQKQKR